MIVVITGASKGLGRAIAYQFAATGHTILACARGNDALLTMAADVKRTYPDAIVETMPTDMAQPPAIKAFANWCLHHGTPDIVVNNAGCFLPGSIATEADGLLEKMINTNLYSAYHLTKALLPAMIENKKGHIFNICSIASLQAYNNGGSYSISKFALLGFSKNLREELKPLGIKVTAIMPGAAYTDSWIGSGVLAERIMEADDVAKMIYAASQLSAQAVVEDIVLRPQLGDL
ncbi:SDR family oxidoreductase [Parasediminibacterium sp. JCM 36343]|uniref:SDR family oxidoreductase n=1 Tax=Parasediminibacterium sp. JCM 36343 TaxID=3374279 RepID=UPI0039790035